MGGAWGFTIIGYIQRVSQVRLELGDGSAKGGREYVLIPIQQKVISFVYGGIYTTSTSSINLFRPLGSGLLST